MNQQYDNPEFDDAQDIGSGFRNTPNSNPLRDGIFSDPPSNVHNIEEEKLSGFGDKVNPSSGTPKNEALNPDYIGSVLSVGDVDDEFDTSPHDDGYPEANIDQIADDIPEAHEPEQFNAPPSRFNKGNLIFGGVITAALLVGGWLMFGGDSEPKEKQKSSEAAIESNAASDVGENNAVPPLPDFSASQTAPSSMTASEVEAANKMVEQSVLGVPASAPYSSNIAPATQPESASQIAAMAQNTPVYSPVEQQGTATQMQAASNPAAIALPTSPIAPVTQVASAPAAPTAPTEATATATQKSPINDNQWALFFNSNQVVTKDEQVKALKDRLSALTGESFENLMACTPDNAPDITAAPKASSSSSGKGTKRKAVTPKRRAISTQSTTTPKGKAVNYTVQAVVFGQMWVKLPNGTYRSYVNGDTAPNGGIIKDINPNTRIMTTTKGSYVLPR